MEVKDNKFFVVSIGDVKVVEQEKTTAIKTLMRLVKEQSGDIKELNPELISVDMNGEKWQLKGLAWDEIALELMRLQK